MPECAERASPPVPPKLIVSKPADEVANTVRPGTLATRRRSTGPSPACKEQGRTTNEWIDVDDSPPRRRRTKKRSRRHEQAVKTIVREKVESPKAESDFGRFFPKLSRILESSNESPTSSRPSTRGSDRSSTRRTRNGEDASVVYRRSPRHRTGGVNRRQESLLKVNPSLLSVLSGLTTTSDKSSGSNSTITQRSYNRRDSDNSITPMGRPRRTESASGSSVSQRTRSRSPNVFDYMQASSVDGDERDGQSVVSSVSSASSHYQPSDAGSSQAPDTPSSRSTFPSPTNTRSTSVAELRRKYDPQYASTTSSVRSNSHSPDPSVRSLRKPPNVSAIAEDDEKSVLEPLAPSEMSYDSRRRSSHSSQDSDDRLHEQQEYMRQHLAHNQQPYQQQYVEPTFGQHRSSSMSSEQSAYAYHMAMQQYQYPSPPAALAPPSPPQAMDGHLAPNHRPPVPDAPDLSQRTLAGYEMLALELATNDSPVRPLYRKFEYLNHRILLHLQDELCELEEQLRVVDEVIAQMDPALPEGHRTPASRRGEAYHGTPIHQRRTSLLGRIFVKTEQYNRAMSSYTTACKDTEPPKIEQVEEYQQWMSKHQPVHEFEARFLQRSGDLIVPGTSSKKGSERPSLQAAFAYLPIPLMLPLLLFAVIPNLAGRLLVTALIAMAAFIVAATTCIRQLMPMREWAVCGAAYVLLMAAIAGCIPQHNA